MGQTKDTNPNIAFRKKDLEKAANIMKLGESFNVVGAPRVGKSRFLRHLAYNKEFAENLGISMAIYYFDLRDCPNSLLEEIHKSLDGSNKFVSLEDALENLFLNLQKVYIILDESMLLNNYDVSEINKLHALRDRYKYKLNFIFSFEHKSSVDYDLAAFYKIAMYTIKLLPLGSSDMRNTVDYISDMYGFKLKPREVKKVIEQAQGYPGRARKIILNMMLGVSDSSLRLDIDKTQVLEESLLFLTKNEYLILKSLLNSSSLFIEKESIACILSPKSGGIGVSDAAISQAVKRLRTKLKSNNIKITIRTKRGFGYIIG